MIWMDSKASSNDSNMKQLMVIDFGIMRRMLSKGIAGFIGFRLTGEGTILYNEEAAGLAST